MKMMPYQQIHQWFHCTAIKNRRCEKNSHKSDAIDPLQHISYLHKPAAQLTVALLPTSDSQIVKILQWCKGKIPVKIQDYVASTNHANRYISHTLIHTLHTLISSHLYILSPIQLPEWWHHWQWEWHWVSPRWKMGRSAPIVSLSDKGCLQFVFHCYLSVQEYLIQRLRMWVRN